MQSLGPGSMPGQKFVSLFFLLHLCQTVNIELCSLHFMLLLEKVYMVLEVAEGRLCLCRSFGQTVHGLMFGARVQSVACV